MKIDYTNKKHLQGFTKNQLRSLKDIEDYKDFTIHELEDLITPKQLMFCNNYMIHNFNGAKAARLSGYSHETAKQIAIELLSKPYLLSYIRRLLSNMILDPDSIKKIVSDAAKGNVAEFMKVVTKTRNVNYEMPGLLVIQEYKSKILSTEKYMHRLTSNGLLTDDDASNLLGDIKSFKRKIIKMEIELEDNPDATVTRSRSEEYETVEIDLPKVLDAEEGGRVKSFKWGEFGPILELQDPADAQKTLLKIHGEFIDRVESKNENINFNADVSFKEGEAKRIADEILKGI